MRRALSPRAASLRLAGLGTVLAVLLAGCVAPREQVTPEVTGAPEPGPALTDVEDFYGQDVVWAPCDELDCATVRAPLDWDDPAAGSIELALTRSPAQGPTEDRVGSLLVNPGGPGVAATEFVGPATASFSERLLAAYDVVGVDPRGVGSSTAVDCGPDEVVDEYLTADVIIESQADVDAAVEAVRAFGQTCLEVTGPLLGEIDTVSSARDLDLVRAVLGDDRLHYAGFSYGTLLGATYAELFPDRVGRLLLDGAMDPSLTSDELVLGQAVGFEDALRAYAAYCLTVAGCPLRGDVDAAMQQVADLVERAGTRPLDAGDGRTANATMVQTGIVLTMYDDALWPYLTEALAEAMVDNRGTFLLELANLYLDRTRDGTYTSNKMIAFLAISCLDHPSITRTYEEMVAFAEEVTAVAPTFGEGFAMGVGCDPWPVETAAERGPVTAAGAAPILVVGTTGDPATPYEWSVALAEQLESGVLLTWDGEGHTAYGRAGACVTDAVDGYLLDGVVPEDGLTC